MLITLYIVLSVLIMSALEWGIHKYLMHKDSTPIPYLSLLYRNHSHQHHGRFYQTFNYEEDEVGRQFALRTEILPNFLLASPLYLLLLLISPTFCIILALTQLFHHITWNVVHNEMHNPASWIIRGIPGYSWLEWHHYLHHKHVNKNFNIVFPIFDFIMGTAAKPTDKDIKDFLVLQGEAT